MSWSVQFIGTPEKVAEALTAHSGKLSDQSKVEFDSALPHMVGICNENFGTGAKIKLAASGHGYAVNEKQQQRQLIVSVETFYAELV